MKCVVLNNFASSLIVLFFPLIYFLIFYFCLISEQANLLFWRYETEDVQVASKLLVCQKVAQAFAICSMSTCVYGKDYKAPWEVIVASVPHLFFLLLKIVILRKLFSNLSCWNFKRAFFIFPFTLIIVSPPTSLWSG